MQPTPLSPPADSIVQLAADVTGLELVPPDQVPPFGTFWLVEPGTRSVVFAPFPCPPLGNTLPTFAIADGIFLVDGTAGQMLPTTPQTGRIATSAMLNSALEAQAEALVNLIATVQDAQFNREFAMAFGLDQETDSANNFSPMLATYDTNLLWLEITNVANGWASLNLHNATNEVYAIWSTTNLLTPWQVETELWPTLDQTNVLSFTVPTLGRQNLFLRAEDWTGVDSDSDELPDWWEWYWFGNYSHSGCELDANGNRLLSDYNNIVDGTITNDPNVIVSSIEVANNYVSTSSPILTMNVTVGTPSYYAVLVDSTNFTEATWTAYTSSNLPASLGSIEGWPELWVGLKGCAPEATVTWLWKRIKLDFTPPQLVITNPVGNTVDVPMIQIYGYCPEPLDRISYDLANALGVVTNQDVGITSQYYDPNTWDFTTNYFECLDVPLTNGVNVITLHATDLAGNVATQNFSYPLDYSNKISPVVQMTWPLDGMKVCGNTVSLRGQVDDPTVTVTAMISDASGHTSTVSGLVERNGRFWVENMPLNSGLNTVSITMSNAINQGTVTTLNLTNTVLALTINPVADDTQLWQPTVSVGGTVSDASYAVWVNGMPATLNGTNWNADNVPTTPGGVACFDATAYPPGETPAGSSGGNGGATVNPQTANAQNTSTNADKPMRLYVYEDTQNYNWTGRGFGKDNNYNSWAQSYATEHYDHYWGDNVDGDATWTAHYDGQNSWNNSWTMDTTGIGSWNASAWPELDPATPIYTYGGLGEFGVFPGPEPGIYVDSLIVGNESCGVNDPQNTFTPTADGSGYTSSHETYRRTAQTVYHLQTGGKSASTKQSLFCLSASAREIGFKRALPPHGAHNYDLKAKAIPMPEITIDGKALGSDGKLWRSYADNDDRDVTPRVKNKDFYTFIVNADNYHPYIKANSHNLDDEKPEFCVGQHLTYTLKGLPSYVDLKGQWNLPAKFVNEPYLYSSNCTSYRINDDLLHDTDQTACWYVNMNKPDGHVSVAMNLKFSNGQTASIAANGDFTVIRPLPSFSITCFGPVQVSPDRTLGFGYDPSPPGICFEMTNIPLDSNGNPYGSYYIEQLMDITVEHYRLGSNYSKHQTGQDGNGVLNGIRDDTGDDVTWKDAPHTQMESIETKLSRHDSFQDFLMFKPGGDAIDVPMYYATWGWGGTEEPVGTLVTPSTHGPTGPVLTTAFPEWVTTFTTTP